MNEEKKLRLTVASSPHVASPIDTTNLMRDVLIALVPAMVMGVVFFGPRALVATIISVLACEFFEWGYRKLMHKSCAVKDLSAAVTGVLLAFVCAPTLPYWMLIIGDFFAIVVVKQLFGGLGKNFMNPALGGRAFLMLCYPVAMTTWVAPGIGTGAWADLLGGTKTMAGVDIVSSATPLSADFMHGGLLPDATILDAFVGNVGGCIGEISALALLLGGVYLIVRGVIRARIPVAYIATVAVLTFLLPLGGNDRLVWMTYQLFTGGLFLGAFFMATDYVTSPVTKKGEIIFGIGCGLLTVFIRYFGGYPEGVSYSILIMNCCVWLIDKVGKPGRYGVTKEMKLDRRGDRGRSCSDAGHQAGRSVDRGDCRVAAGIGELIAIRGLGSIHGSFALFDRQLLLFKGHGMVFRRLDGHNDLRRCGLAAAERDRSRAGLHRRQRDRAAAGRSVDRSWDRHDGCIGRLDRQHVAARRARERHGQGSSLRVVSIDLNGRSIGRDRSHAQLHSDLDAAERLRFSVLCHRRRDGGGANLQCLDRRAVNNADNIGMVTAERHVRHSSSVCVCDADPRRVADLQRGISRCD